MRLQKLTQDEINAETSALTGWKVESDILAKLFVFGDFVAAIKFVDALAVAAENMNHHPDMDIRYNKVKVQLTTHDAGGLTANDFQLARAADSLIS